MLRNAKPRRRAAVNLWSNRIAATIAAHFIHDIVTRAWPIRCVQAHSVPMPLASEIMAMSFVRNISLSLRGSLALTQASFAVILLCCSSCTRCDRSADSEPVRSGPAPLPSILSARAGRLAPILAHNSSDCLACAVARCQDRIDKCAKLEGLADAGPARGTPKVQLCEETLDCAIKSRCVQAGSGKDCYCGTAKGLDCLSSGANGTCKSKLEASLETTAPAQVSGNFGDDTRGGGAAMQLVQCLINQNCERCF